MNEFTLESEVAHQREVAEDLRDGSSPVADALADDEPDEAPEDDDLQIKVEGDPIAVAVRAWPLALAIMPFVLLAIAFRWLYLKVASSARRDAIDQDAERRR